MTTTPPAEVHPRPVPGHTHEYGPHDLHCIRCGMPTQLGVLWRILNQWMETLEPGDSTNPESKHYAPEWAVPR